MTIKGRIALSENDKTGADTKIKLGVLSDLIGVRLFRARIAVLKSLEEHSEKLGNTPGEFYTLALIHSNPGLSQVEISRHVYIDKSSMVALIDRLTNDGLAVRKRSKLDRRRSELFITPAGEEQLQKLRQVYLESESAFDSLFTKTERTQLFELLSRFDAFAE